MRDAGLYDDPVVYDILHTPGTAGEVEGLARMWRRWCSPRRAGRGEGGAHARPVWLEPACGTGRYLRLAARRGFRVLGVDRSPGMIRYARRRLARMGIARRADLRVGDMTSLPADWRGRVDFAFNLINTIRHLPTDAAVLAHLRSVARVLRPGGVYAVGLTLTAYGMEFPSEDVWEGRRGLCRVKQVVDYIPPISPREERARAERVISHVMITRGVGRAARTEHRNSRYTLRTYGRRQWESLIARSPLRIAATVDESGRVLHVTPGGYAIWLLARRGDPAFTRWSRSG